MIKNWFITTLKYTAPFFMLLVPAMIGYGFYSPWEPSQEPLSKYENSVALYVGLNKQSGTNSGGPYSSESRTYLVVDKNLNSRYVTVFTENGAYKKVEIDEGGLMWLALTYLALVVIIWYFWVKPHNKSLKVMDRANRAAP